MTDILSCLPQMESAQSFCLYCGRLKNRAEFSEEHVLPRSLGGNLFPSNPFKTNKVCRTCNNACGRYVDGPFVKSWLTHNKKVESAFSGWDLQKNLIFPFSYMGTVGELTHEDRICEMWLGSSGDSIFHFHRPVNDTDLISTVFGRPPHVRKENFDPGFVIVLFVATNPVWFASILKTAQDLMPGARIILGNVSNLPPLKPPFEVDPPDLIELVRKMTERSQQGQGYHCSIAFDLSISTRFLSKLSLGIGGLMLHTDFITSAHANLLRRGLWERSFEEIQKLPIYNHGFLSRLGDNLSPLISCRSCHTISLIPLGNVLVLVCKLYGNHAGSMILSDEPRHWKDFIRDDGYTYIISPSIQTVVGPVWLPDFLAHKAGNKLNAELLVLEERIDALPMLPPKHVATSS